MGESRRDTLSASVWTGRTVVITGGTGTFGAAFVKHALQQLDVAEVRVFSRDEYKQAMLGQQLGHDARLRLCIGDVRDRDRLGQVFAGADIVVHAAALKRVDTEAYDPVETIKTNVLGSINVVDAAEQAGVSRVLAISSDKAAEPVTSYGATKLLMEHFCTWMDRTKHRRKYGRLACVRYGNVLGSRGSVLELWAAQRARGEPLTITGAGMCRFWITVPQAVAFVTAAVEEMRGGEVFVPDLPYGFVSDLAAAAHPGWPVQQLGCRPGGEKSEETIISPHESRFTYRLPAPLGGLPAWVILPDHPEFYPDGLAQPPGVPLGHWVRIAADGRAAGRPPMITHEYRALLASAGLIGQDEPLAVARA